MLSWSSAEPNRDSSVGHDLWRRFGQRGVKAISIRIERIERAAIVTGRADGRAASRRWSGPGSLRLLTMWPARVRECGDPTHQRAPAAGPSRRSLMVVSAAVFCSACGNPDRALSGCRRVSDVERVCSGLPTAGSGFAAEAETACVETAGAPVSAMVLDPGFRRDLPGAPRSESFWRRSLGRVTATAGFRAHGRGDR